MNRIGSIVRNAVRRPPTPTLMRNRIWCWKGKIINYSLHVLPFFLSFHSMPDWKKKGTIWIYYFLNFRHLFSHFCSYADLIWIKNVHAYKTWLFIGLKIYLGSVCITNLSVRSDWATFKMFSWQMWPKYLVTFLAVFLKKWYFLRSNCYAYFLLPNLARLTPGIDSTVLIPNTHFLIQTTICTKSLIDWSTKFGSLWLKNFYLEIIRSHLKIKSSSHSISSKLIFQPSEERERESNQIKISCKKFSYSTEY